MMRPVSLPILILAVSTMAQGCCNLVACSSVSGLIGRPTRGLGSRIDGVVTQIDRRRNTLVTDLPCKWMMAASSDEHPLIGRKMSQLEGLEFILDVGGRKFVAVFACHHGSLPDGTWVIEGGYFPGMDEETAETARIGLAVLNGNAVEVSGASVGTRVRLTKTDGYDGKCRDGHCSIHPMEPGQLSGDHGMDGGAKGEQEH